MVALVKLGNSARTSAPRPQVGRGQMWCSTRFSLRGDCPFLQFSVPICTTLAQRQRLPPFLCRQDAE